MILTYLDLVFDDDISASSVEGMLYESYFILFWLKLTFFFSQNREMQPLKYYIS